MSDEDTVEIEMFVSCIMCHDELPKGESLYDFARLTIGVTNRRTLVVWCERHNRLVVDIKDLQKFIDSAKCAKCADGVEHMH